MSIDQLRALCRENEIKFRANAGEAALAKKLKAAGIDVPEPEEVGSGLNESFKAVQDLADDVAAHARNCASTAQENPKAYKTARQDYDRALKSLGQGYESLLVEVRKTGDEEYLLKYLQWARDRDLKIHPSDIQVLNRMEWERADLLAVCKANFNPAWKVDLNDEVRCNKDFDHVRKADLYTFYPIVKKSPFEQEPKHLADRKKMGYQPDITEYPTEYDQYWRFQMVAGEFEKYFDVQ